VTYKNQHNKKEGTDWKGAQSTRDVRGKGVRNEENNGRRGMKGNQKVKATITPPYSKGGHYRGGYRAVRMGGSGGGTGTVIDGLGEGGNRRDP